MYKQNLKTKCTLFTTLLDKQSHRYCKTICKNLHCHCLPCRLLIWRSHTPSTSFWISTSAALSTRSRSWWPCRGGQLMDSSCPFRTCISTCQRWCGPCVPCGLTFTPAWCISTPVKVSDKTIFSPLTTQLKIVTEFWPNNAVPCEFWQSTICHFTIHKGNPAPIVLHSGSQLTAPNYVQQTKQ